MKLGQLAGWIGFLLVLLAYGLLSFGVLTPRSLLYVLCNVCGAALLAHASWKRKAYQPLAIYVVWVFISLAALL